MNRLIIFSLLILFSLTTTWAGQGWYLMMAPFIQMADPKHPDDPMMTWWMSDQKAPISEWSIKGSFDSAKECNDEKKLLRDEADLKLKKDGGAKIPPFNEYILAQCITSDDPRLKK